MKKIVMPIWLRAVQRTNRFIFTHYGESFPIYVVSEYPKSGGTWLGRMVAECLQLPFPQRYRLPLALPCVVHTHWAYDSRLARPIYLYRDGRDVMVSLYFHRIRRIAEQRYVSDWRHKQVHERLFGKGYDAADITRHLPRFIENEFDDPRDSRLTWRQHIESWFDPDNRPQVAYLSYESLLSEAETTLSRTVGHVADEPVDAWRVQMAVEKFSMARQTGRAPGEEDRASFIRKGVAGDWVNHFSREASKIFNDLAGDTLIKLGYETDANWVNRIDATGNAPD
jgi:hypothetical protein